MQVVSRRASQSHSSLKKLTRVFSSHVRADMKKKTTSSSPSSAVKLSQVPLGQVQLPRVPTTTLWKVWYVEQYIQMGQTRALSELFQTVHSGIAMRSVDALQEEHSECPREMTFEYFALRFPFGAVLPRVAEENENSTTAIAWENEACVGFSNSIDDDRWMKQQTYVGTVTGETMNDFFEFCDRYQQENPRYQLFDVWDRPELATDTQQFVQSSVCSTFSQEALKYLSTRGATFRTSVLLYRNYVPLLTAEDPVEVDENDAAAMEEVTQFYTDLAKSVARNMSISEFLESTAQKMRVFFIYDGIHSKDGGATRYRYLRVKLEPPYIVLSALYQPMLTPWTSHEAIPSSSQTYVMRTGRQVFRISEAVNGAAQLLISRAPDIISRRASYALSSTAIYIYSGLVLVLVVLPLIFGIQTTLTLLIGFFSGCLSTLIFFGFKYAITVK